MKQFMRKLFAVSLFTFSTTIVLGAVFLPLSKPIIDEYYFKDTHIIDGNSNVTITSINKEKIPAYIIGTTLVGISILLIILLIVLCIKLLFWMLDVIFNEGWK